MIKRLSIIKWQKQLSIQSYLKTLHIQISSFSTQKQYQVEKLDTWIFFNPFKMQCFRLKSNVELHCFRLKFNGELALSFCVTFYVILKRLKNIQISSFSTWHCFFVEKLDIWISGYAMFSSKFECKVVFVILCHVLCDFKKIEKYPDIQFFHPTLLLCGKTWYLNIWKCNVFD